MRKVPIVDIEDLLQRPIPPVNWVVKGLFAKKDLVLVYGQPGAMKSYLLLDLALHLAHGQDWLGHTIKHPQRVLYVDEEMGEDRTQRRIQRLAAGLTFRPERGMLATMSFSLFKLQENDPNTLLMMYMDAYKCMPDVIVIESFRKIMSGDENSAGDVALAWKYAYEFKGHGLTTIVSHHTRKDSADIESGSGYLTGGVDISLAVSKLADDKLHLKHKKDRDTKTPPELDIYVYNEGDVESGPLRFSTEVHKATNAAQDQIVRMFLNSEERGAKTSDIADWMLLLDFSSDQIERALKALKDNGVIISPRRGYWRLNDEKI